MTAWVALLRAINVSGQNVIPMADMRAAMVDMGFAGAKSYLASGNVMFSADGGSDDPSDHVAAALAAKIRAGIEATFGHDVTVLMRSRDHLGTVIDTVPWQYPANSSSGVVFMNGPVQTGLDATRFEPDAMHVVGTDIHVDCPTGFGKTKLTVAWLERQTGLAGTRRNWKTVRTLHDKLAEFE